MKITRTANAGVLLTIDGVSILLDGVCGEHPPYRGTPSSIRQNLEETFPDILAFTHHHPDHYDGEFAELYRKATNRPVFEPPFCETIKVGNVEFYGVESRHLGRSDQPHISFIIKGTECVWFLGDASPNSIKKIEGLPKPDVVIVPYAYANTESSFETTKGFGAKDIIILHLPENKLDEYKICETVNGVIKDYPFVHLIEIGESLIL